MPTPIILPKRLPTSVPSMGAPPPENGEIRKAAEDALAGLKYSVATVLANPQMRVRPGSLEETLKTEIAKIEPKKLAAYQATAKEMVELSPGGRAKIFGRYGALSAQEFAAVGFERASEVLKEPLRIDAKLLGAKIPSISVPPGTNVAVDGDDVRLAGLAARRDADLEDSDWEAVQAHRREEATASNVVNLDRLADVWGPLSSDDVLVDPDDFEGQEFLDKLALKIERVKCVDETNPEWPGSDEIKLGGVSVDETGDTKKIGEQKIGGGFDDGDQKSYSPDWQYHWFGVREEMVANQWPKKYLVTLVLAEEDNGGLGAALNRIWAKVKGAVKEKIQQAIGAALTPYLGAVIANAIGVAVAWVVDTFVGWIINLFNDDIFPPANCWMTHAGPNARFTVNGQWGSPRSRTLRAHFYGHGGHYYVDYHWLLYK